MKALTLWPEWAWAIAHLGKDCENRTWPAPRWLVGRLLAIHAGKNVGGHPGAKSFHSGISLVRELAVKAGHDPGAFAEWLNTMRSKIMESTGAVVSVATVGAPGEVNSPWAARSQRQWPLLDVVPLSPVRCRGAQGLWDLPPTVEEAVREQLRKAGTR